MISWQNLPLWKYLIKVFSWSKKQCSVGNQIKKIENNLLEKDLLDRFDLKIKPFTLSPGGTFADGRGLSQPIFDKLFTQIAS